ncbi:MAG TPA: TonB-dependent receptor plug domain-containing protein, partial [Thermoanaerobaculia bacterium]|nr:TonB-dependent receptor plug domain-containing protein [Thermoanaerobaculia bacterium]
MIGPALLLAAAAAAQAADAPRPRFAQEIVVVAERGPSPRDATPAAVTTLTREDLARLPAATLAEVLDAVPGVFVLQAAPWSGPPMASARGFFGGGEAEYLQLRVDGLPVLDTESGLADWQRLGTAQLERVEVLRGPGSALYGDTALGGVVEVVTRHAAGAAGGALALAGGSFGTASAEAVWHGTAAGLEVGAAAAGLATDGARAHAAAE